MEIKQKRYFNRAGFAFGEDELKYSIQGSSGSRTFSVPYTDISRGRQTLEERNQWLPSIGESDEPASAAYAITPARLLLNQLPIL